MAGLCDSVTDGELQMFHFSAGTAALVRLIGVGVGGILNAKPPHYLWYEAEALIKIPTLIRNV